MSARLRLTYTYIGPFERQFDYSNTPHLIRDLASSRFQSGGDLKRLDLLCAGTPTHCCTAPPPQAAP